MTTVAADNAGRRPVGAGDAGRPAAEDLAAALRPLAECDHPPWRVTIVVDSSPSMDLWQEPIADFVAILRDRGGFPRVTTGKLHTGSGSDAALELLDPGAGDDRVGLALVITDGVAPAWHSGAAAHRLRGWALQAPVAVIHVLPHQLWYRTGIRPRRLRLGGDASGLPNATLRWSTRYPVPAELLDGGADPESGAAVPIPVLELSPTWLATWVKLVTGAAADDGVTLPGLVTGPALGEADPPEDASDDGSPAADPRQQVRQFTSWATPTAVALATYLAAVPLNLPMIREVQRRLVPSSDTSHLSEIFNSGLLRPVGPEPAQARPDRVAYEFNAGVRAELLASARRTETVRALRVVDRYLGPSVPAVQGLREVLRDPDAGPERPVTPETVPFVRAEQAALQALSGPYLARSRRLSANLPPEPASEPVAASHVTRSSGGTVVSSPTATDDHGPISTAAGSSSGVPEIWGNVPPRNPNFTGRRQLLERLRELMRSGTTAVLPHALHGMGGVGKSQLAVEYVYRHQDAYDVIWWVSAERPPQAKGALVELGHRMGLDITHHVNAALPVVLDALRVGRPYRNWLLVFDNAESPEGLRDCIPSGGPGTILVTSRNPQWAAAASALEVDVFTRDESTSLLLKRRPEIGEAEADKLAEALGDLPLAIEQAAAWLAETGMRAEEYLALFEEKRAELLRVSAPVDYQLPVALAWNVSLDRLAARSPAALRLLQVCSFLASEPIPRSLLGGAHSTEVHPDLNQTMRDPMRLNRAIRDINRYALAKINYRDNSLHMHRLVQAVLIDRLPEEERAVMRRSAHLLLASSDRNDPVTPANWPTYAELYPHLMASEAYKSTDPWVMQLVVNEAYYLYWWGDHESARELSRITYEFRLRELGQDHPSTLRIGRWLSFMHFITGRYGEAARLNVDLLAAHERITTEDTEELLDAIGAIAADHRVAGRFQEALQLAEDVYQRYVRAFGEDDPETLNAAHNLAVSLRLVGEFRRALEIDQQVLDARRLLLSEDHPHTLKSAQHAILDRRELGDYVAAQSAQRNIYEQLKSLLDPLHPNTLSAMRQLSASMRKAGEHAAARTLAEQARAHLLSRYGPAHPETIVATLNLAIDHRANGDPAGSAELCAEVYQGYRRLLGDDHPHTQAAALNQAIAERLRGNLAAARRLNEHGLEVLTGSLGEEHPMVLACRLNLASDLYEQGEHQQAYELDVVTEERLRRVWGEEHPTTLAARGNLAMDLNKLGRSEEAQQIHTDVVARFERLLGPHHPATRAAADLDLRADCDLDPMPM